MRIRTHSALPLRREFRQLTHQASLLIEKFLWFIAAHPAFKHFKVLRVSPHRSNWHLMRAKCAFNWQAVHHFGSCPALGGAQDNNRPLRGPGKTLLTSLFLGEADAC